MQLDIFGSNERENEICRLYWETDSDGFKWNISQIAKEFGISSYEVQKTAKNNSKAYSDEHFCQHCDAPYLYSSRQNYISARPYKWVCDDCESEMQNRSDEMKISAIKKSIDINSKISLDILSARDAVFLLTLLRHSASEDLSCLNELSLNISDPLSPSHEYSICILKELFNSRLIAVSPNSNLEHITIADGGGFRFYLDRVKWLIPLEEGVGLSSFIAGLEEKVSSQEYIETDYEGISSLCQEVSLKECLAYLNLVLRDHGFDFSPGEKTELVINRALQDLSVAQIYNLIWRAGKDAASYYLRSNVSKKQAANIVVGSIERSLERSFANGWEIKPYRRNYNAPQSVLSRVLFNVLLHTDDGGFNQVLKDII